MKNGTILLSRVRTKYIFHIFSTVPVCKWKYGSVPPLKPSENTTLKVKKKINRQITTDNWVNRICSWWLLSSIYSIIQNPILSQQTFRSKIFTRKDSDVTIQISSTVNTGKRNSFRFSTMELHSLTVDVHIIHSVGSDFY